MALIRSIRDGFSRLSVEERYAPIAMRHELVCAPGSIGNIAEDDTRILSLDADS